MPCPLVADLPIQSHIHFSDLWATWENVQIKYLAQVYVYSELRDPN